MYSYDNYQNMPSDAVAASIILSFLMFLLIMAFAAYAVTSWLSGRIFKKAGVEQWIAWVPVYNTWKLLEIGGQQGFWAVLGLIPIVNIVSAVFIYIAMFNIGKRLGKEDWFVLVAILLPLVWLIWLAFDDSKWHGPKPGKVTAAAK